MGLGIIAFSTIKEPVKFNIKNREKNFRTYLKNSSKLLKEDTVLKDLILSQLLSYSYLLVLPFIIIDAAKSIELSGAVLGLLVSLQMSGAMLSNIVWGRLAYNEKNGLVIVYAYLSAIVAIFIALSANEIWHYSVLFFLIGGAMDGFRLAYNNLIIMIVSDENRPVYLALQANLTSIGLFFSIPGGLIVILVGFDYLAMISICALIIGAVLSYKRSAHL